jgi:hypothetical protein
MQKGWKAMACTVKILLLNKTLWKTSEMNLPKGNKKLWKQQAQFHFHP